MVNTKILISVVIVLAIGIAAAGYQITTTTPGLWQPTVTSQQQNPASQDKTTISSSGQDQSGNQGGTTPGQGQNGGNNVKILSQQAKSLAKNYIQESGATAGTPQLKTMNGEKVYIVPVMKSGKQVGEIWIDPQTGKNVGGAGGAP